ncbi:MAG: AI-2E family transporter, partial [Chitinophagia bacterium]|nr:AI-2E family transporter [Chitinophagia bacterium]
MDSGYPELVAVPVVLQLFHFRPWNRFCAMNFLNFGFELPSWWPGSRAIVTPRRGCGVGDVDVVVAGADSAGLCSAAAVAGAMLGSSKLASTTATASNDQRQIIILSLIFITPILIFYFLKDWNIIVNNFKSHLPKKFALLTEKILSDLDKSLSGFVRGQLLVCIVMAIFYSLILSIWGLNFGFAIGFITGILTFIPYVGAITGFFIAILVALFQYNFILSSIVPIIFIFALGQFIEANFLVPKLVGLRIGLHPVWIVFGLFVFGALFGLFGVFFATPLTAIFGVLIKHAS